LRVLITAGPTREYLDPVRYLSNDSSGRMGFAIAAAAARRGMRVTLVHGPVELPVPPGVRAVRVVSAADMLEACLKLWPRQDALIMAAAVADYTPIRRARFKRKKSRRPVTVRLKPTPDILAELSRRRRPDQIVVGFALEDRDARRRARKKLEQKRLDAIILNRPSAIGSTESAIEVYAPGYNWRRCPRRPKSRHAAAIVRLLDGLLAKARCR